jgi:hypothetical protein
MKSKAVMMMLQLVALQAATTVATSQADDQAVGSAGFDEAAALLSCNSS